MNSALKWTREDDCSSRRFAGLANVTDRQMDGRTDGRIFDSNRQNITKQFLVKKRTYYNVCMSMENNTFLKALYVLLPQAEFAEYNHTWHLQSTAYNIVNQNWKHNIASE